jgi:hypothetical protein
MNENVLVGGDLMVNEIDATELFKLIQDGIDKEIFDDAKSWINIHLYNMTTLNPAAILAIKNTKAKQTYYWRKKEIDDLVNILNKLEELYKKRSSS